MKFNEMWLPSINSKNFFSPRVERKLKEKYGIWATIHSIVSVVILFIPFIVFMFFIPKNALEPATSSGNMLGAVGGILGLIGSLSIGVGVVNLFMLIVKQYLGHIVTLVSIVAGFSLSFLALYIFSFVK